MRKSKAFTLVELLVVIGIIALLISILLPTLNKAREQASRVKCQSNMRTLMMACIMYGGENNQYMPFANWQSGSGASTPAPGGNGWDATNTYAYGWLYQALSGPNNKAPRIGYPPGSDLNGPWGAHPPLDGMQTGVLWPYIRQMAVYHCPMDTDTAPYVGTHWITSYVMNGAAATFSETPPTGIADTTTGQMTRPGLKFTQVRDSADRVLLWEGFEGSYENASFTGSFWNDGSSSAWEETMTDRHFMGANVAYLDGHVDWLDAGTFYFYAKVANATNYTGPVAPAGTVSPFYWNPFNSTGQ